MSTLAAYFIGKYTEKVPVEKSVENVENSGLSTDIPVWAQPGCNRETEF